MTSSPSTRSLRRAAVAVPGLAALALATVVAAPASAQTGVHCGSVITHSVQLSHDLGPCPGNGLVVTADNITVDLNGHTITGPHGTSVEPTPGEHVGVKLKKVSGVTVTSGEIQGFDAGVGLGSSNGNIVRNLNIHHNINHSALGGAINNCNFGDGIALFSSDNNLIVGNRVANNGPLSGIALVYDSDGNKVVRNRVLSNDVKALTPEGEGILCGTGEDQGPMGSGRPVQDMGIRIEGPGANNNRIVNNLVVDNALFGIAVHPNVCAENPSGAPPAPPNNGNFIINNTVRGTGSTISDEVESIANGIAVFAAGPPGTVCTADNTTIIGNNSSNNDQHGILIEGRGSSGNRVIGNTTNNNDGDGIHFSGPDAGLPGVVHSVSIGNRASGNGGYNAFDGTENCGTNKWRGGQYHGDVNQPCVAGPISGLQ